MRVTMMRASQSPLFEVPTLNVSWLRLLSILLIQKLIAQFQEALTTLAETNRVTDTASGMQQNAESTQWSETDAQWALKGDLDW